MGNLSFTRRAVLLGGGTAGLIGIAAGTVRGQSVADFKIGVISSLTGPASAYSKDYHEGFVAYVKAWNERGGFLGRKVILQVLDDETNPLNAVNAFRRLASDPAIMMIWTSIGSQTALGIKAIASEFKVPVISGGGIDALGKPADPWFFKMAPGASDFVKGLVEYAQQRGITSIATLNSTDAFGQSEAEALKGLARKANIKLVAAETFGTADTNFIPQLVRINQAKPGFFYNGSNGASSILIFKQIKQLNFNLSMAVSLTAINAAFYKGIGGRENANGVLSIVPLGAVAEQVGGEVARLYAECEKALSKPPLLFHTWGWDTGLVAEHALKRSDGTRPAIRDALDQIRDLPAINGPLTYTPENHIGQDTRGLTLAKLEDGKWAIVR